ncbi:15-hydroxyprostaglandin dehydrogenase [NAD(+)] [Holothuria leucospilota]|uniref:15-hydroxyprostaglandin dehydrogenase [NAD(+)] n=1 Tax=Holothuria leucospilota TaxID=206669 RepID=A0A9Q1BJJ3_HOLLE|nr:15-hydroxyprostaglandin dehydrogenase [NAD(+)] [Holothuria leucospilota]
MKVDGKVALVTGGASGIGKALCLRLLESGAKVSSIPADQSCSFIFHRFHLVAIVDFDQEGGMKAASEFGEKFSHDRVKFIECDVTNDDKLKCSFQEAYDVHGALDIVVNNAGIASKDHMKTLKVNLIAVMNGVLFAEELMTKEPRSEKGVIINTASMAGKYIG